jgi:hypothetical protein
MPEGGHAPCLCGDGLPAPLPVTAQPLHCGASGCGRAGYWKISLNFFLMLPVCFSMKA